MIHSATIADDIKSKGWSKEMFAEEMRQTVTQIENWLNGTYNFNNYTLEAIAIKMNIKIWSFEVQTQIILSVAFVISPVISLL